jgi:signal transduction histidine kinase/CheY-like chemotaxis protein
MATKTLPQASARHVDIRRLVLHAVALPLLLMALVSGGLAWQIERLVSVAGAVERAERVIAQANEVQKRIVDQETGLRGFIVTVDRLFLAESPAQLDAVAVLRSRYREWHQQAAVTLTDPKTARASASMIARKAEMDMVRARVASIIAREDSLRDARARMVEVETRFTTLGSVVALVGLGGTLSLLTRKRLRQVADTYEEALSRSAESEAALAELVEAERDAREKAQDALRAKDEFLSTLSHELRTPLTAILGWAGVLRVKKVSAETVDRAMASIERNARAQAQIVDDILDVSRIVAGKFQLRLASTDITTLVLAAIDVVRFSAESKGVTLEAALDGQPIRMVGDPDRLQQVVWNLLSNAIKFTPRNGRVEVRVGRVDSRVHIQVRDTGEGIRPEFLPHVFERFRQADSSLKRPHGGLGLGLSIVKHLVDLHGGDVRVESAGVGRGAVFTVTLPVAAADYVLAPSPPRESAPHPVSLLEGIRVLVVDDDPDSLAVLAAILREHGARVESAASGAAALAILERGPVDVLVSDIGMPELDGYELIQKIRAAAPAPPALALTAYAAAADVERSTATSSSRRSARRRRCLRSRSRPTPPSRTSSARSSPASSGTSPSRSRPVTSSRPSPGWCARAEPGVRVRTAL